MVRVIAAFGPPSPKPRIAIACDEVEDQYIRPLREEQGEAWFEANRRYLDGWWELAKDRIC